MAMLANDIGPEIDTAAGRIEEKLVAIRRDIHAHPETGFDTIRTSALVADQLKAAGIDVVSGVGRTGVVGTIETGRPGPTVLLRADMDALPIHEMTGLDFASTVDGKMHACGHDLHTATLIGVGILLRDLAPRLNGTVRLMFQPAEETSESGARAMIEDGVLDGVDVALGFHNQPDEDVGTFSYIPGISNGSSDEFSILVRGRSGHAARPHLAADPIIAAATLVLQLQTIVSREVDPMHPAVLTIGGISGGMAENIIPDTVRLIGTVRTQLPANRDLIEDAIRRQCDGISTSMNVRCDFTMVRGVPAMVHDEKVTTRTMQAIADHFGQGAIRRRDATLGAEDFALISERVPTFQLGVGSRLPGRDDKLHNSDYQPDERSIRNGVVGLTLAACSFLSSPQL
ncbi:M20 metallopeptidase family protein [Aureimonas altamirensis]|nr:M20 family metallopeptidase [Aureimonas altamirensis]